MKKSDFLNEIQQLALETEQELQVNKKELECALDASASNNFDIQQQDNSVVKNKIQQQSKQKKQPKKSLSKTELSQKYPYAHPHGGHRERVKEALDYDPDFETFSEVEVLEYLLFATMPRIDTNEYAHELLSAFGSLSGVLNAQVAELKSLPFIKENTARMLTAILPVARRAEQSRLKNNVLISNTAEAVNYMAPFFANRTVEHVYLACLSNSDKVIAVERIAVGDTNYANLEIKKIVETACRRGAVKALLAHNHPSGNVKPSEDDRRLTARILISLMSLNIMLVDHIIFTPDSYYSFFANREFESMYAYADEVFSTSLVQELRLRLKSYREGVYPFGAENDIKESEPTAVYNTNIESTTYAMLHPKPQLKIERRVADDDFRD